jgi:hypothetical protein
MVDGVAIVGRDATGAGCVVHRPATMRHRPQ